MTERKVQLCVSGSISIDPKEANVVCAIPPLAVNPKGRKGELRLNGR